MLPSNPVAKRSALEDRLAALAALRDDPHTAEAKAALKKALGLKTALLVATAADVVGEGHVTELLEVMAAAFDRFVANGPKADPLCRAKIAIVKALQMNEWTEEAPFDAAIRLRQLEPTWDGAIDTAGELRAIAALGLAQARHPRVLDDLVVLLLDDERVGRVGAARALGDSGRHEAVPLLRYKILAGDPEPEVLTECFGSLLHLEPEASFAFARQHLDASAVELREAAALALGQSRNIEAVRVLGAWAAERPADERRVAYVAIALVRAPEAFDHLIAVISEQAPEDAAMALDALQIHAHDPKLVERIEATIDRRGDRDLRERFLNRF